MEKHTDRTVTSTRNFSVLNSTLSEIIIDFLDDETLLLLQNKLINVINIRYGDSIERNLRNDDQFRHLFENHKETAHVPNPSNSLVESLEPNSSTNPEYKIAAKINKVAPKKNKIALKTKKIASKHTACDIKSKKKQIESKTKNVLKISRKLKKINIADKNLHMDSIQNKKLLPKVYSPKVIVESVFTNKTDIESPLVPESPAEFNIDDENTLSKINLQQEAGNKQERRGPDLNMKDKLISKFQSLEVSKSEENTENETPLNEDNKLIQNNFPKNLVTYARKLKKPNHDLQKKFEIESSSNNSVNDVKSKLFLSQFYEHAEVPRVQNLESPKKPPENSNQLIEISSGKQENKVNKSLNIVPTKTDENNFIKKHMLENGLYEEKLKRKLDSFIGKETIEFPSVKTQLEYFLLFNEDKQKYKDYKVNILPLQEKENTNLIISPGKHYNEIVDKIEKISILEETKKSNIKKSPSVTIESQKYHKETSIDNKQDSKINKGMDNHCLSTLSNINEEKNKDLKDNKMNEEPNIFKFLKDGNAKYEKERKNITINCKQEVLTVTSDVNINEEAGLRMNEERNVSIFKNDINDEKKEVDIETNEEQDIEEEEKREIDIIIDEEQYVLTLTTSLDSREKKEVDIKINEEQFASNVNVEDKKEIKPVKIDDEQVVTIDIDENIEERDVKINEKQDVSSFTSDINGGEKKEMNIKINEEQDLSTFTTDFNKGKKKEMDIIINNEQYLLSFTTDINGKNEKKSNIKINEEQNIPTLTTDVNGIEKIEAPVKINEEQDISKIIIDEEEKQELKDIKMNHRQNTLKNESVEKKYLKERQQSLTVKEDIPEKDNQKTIMNSITKITIEENELHITPNYKNVIEYVKISSDEEENNNEIIDLSTDAEDFEIRKGVQHKPKPVDLLYPNYQCFTQTSDNTGNFNEKLGIYSEVICNEENTNKRRKIDEIMNFGRNIILKVVYKKENCQKNTVSVLSDETQTSKEKVIEEIKNDVIESIPKREYELNGIKNTKKRGREETDNNYLTPKTLKYNLRSSVSEQKKKKRRRLYGQTEIITRSRAASV